MNVKTVRLQRSRMRRLRASLLALATITVLTAGMFPGCAGEVCCTRPGTPVVHGQMSCCEQPTVERRDVTQRVATAPAGSAHPAPVVAETASPDATPVLPRVRPALAAILAHPGDSSPPRFLLNAQFLI